MKYDEFIRAVQKRGRMSSLGEAVGATRATLQALAQRLQPSEAEHLGSQLPREVAHYLGDVQGPERFDLKEFFERVGRLEHADVPDAVYHARAVVAVLRDAVTPGEIRKVRAQLPPDFDALFDAGTEGNLSR